MKDDDWDIGRFMRVRERADGTHRVFMEVPERFRPEGWPATISVPQISRRGEGRNPSLHNAGFLARVRREAIILNERLDERREREALLARANGKSVADLALIYENSTRHKGLSEARRYRNMLWVKRIGQWCEARGLLDFATIMRPDVEDFLAQYDDRPFARLDARSVWNILCKEAIGAGWRTDQPVADLDWKAPEPAQPNIWTLDDAAYYREVAERCGERVIGVFIEVQMRAGQRLGDLLACRHGQHYRNGWFVIRQSKLRGAKQRVVKFPIPRHLRDMIESIRQFGNDAVFPDVEGGGSFIATDFWKRYNELRHAASEEGDKLLKLLHLRHSAVCQMAKAGLSDFEIAGITGHNYATVRRILERYAIDRAGFAAQGARKLHLAAGGAAEDFTELSELDDSDWFIDGEARPKYKRPWSTRMAAEGVPAPAI